MTKETLIQKNLDLHAEWMRYVFDHPDILDRIPHGAVLVILPEDDPETYVENAKVVDINRSKGISVVVVKMKTPRPQISAIEVVPA